MITNLIASITFVLVTNHTGFIPAEPIPCEICGTPHHERRTSTQIVQSNRVANVVIEGEIKRLEISSVTIGEIKSVSTNAINNEIFNKWGYLLNQGSGYYTNFSQKFPLYAVPPQTTKEP